MPSVTPRKIPSQSRSGRRARSAAAAGCRPRISPGEHPADRAEEVRVRVGLAQLGRPARRVNGSRSRSRSRSTLAEPARAPARSVASRSTGRSRRTGRDPRLGPVEAVRLAVAHDTFPSCTLVGDRRRQRVDPRPSTARDELLGSIALSRRSCSGEPASGRAASERAGRLPARAARRPRPRVESRSDGRRGASEGGRPQRSRAASGARAGRRRAGAAGSP